MKYTMSSEKDIVSSVEINLANKIIDVVKSYFLKSKYNDTCTAKIDVKKN